MDCVIPSHNIKTFTTAIGALCRVGKELYVDFDPLDGLTLRTINDAKSAYASFHFDPSFFERCHSSAVFFAVASDGADAEATGAVTAARQRIINRKRSRSSKSTSKSTEQQHQEENYEKSEEKYRCRVPLRTVHSVLYTRKGVQSLRLLSSGTPPATDHKDEGGALMQLSFEFRIVDPNSNANSKIVHRLGVADAEGVTALAPKEGCSEIVVHPKLLCRMLDPLKRTTEVAFTVSDKLKVVTATSFHHGDATAASADNVLLNAAAASVLKTETSIGCDEFDEYHWRDDNPEEGNGAGASEGGGDVGPVGVNEEVTLVFGVKEVKAMIQFCSQSTTDEGMRVIVSFHWGGRPVTFEAEGDSFSVELIMATLDHKLLRGRSEMIDA